MIKKNFIFSLNLMLFLSYSCSNKSDAFAEIDIFQPSVFTDPSEGRLYLPSGWSDNDIDKWPVTIILHSYGEFSWSFSEKSIRRITKEKLYIVYYLEGYILIDKLVQEVLLKNKQF